MTPLVAAVLFSVSGLGATAWAVIRADGGAERGRRAVLGLVLITAGAVALYLVATPDAVLVDPVADAFEDLDEAAEHEDLIKVAAELTTKGFTVDVLEDRVVAAVLPSAESTLCVMGDFTPTGHETGAVAPQAGQVCGTELAAATLDALAGGNGNTFPTDPGPVIPTAPAP